MISFSKARNPVDCEEKRWICISSGSNLRPIHTNPSPGAYSLGFSNQRVFVFLQDTVIYDRLADSSRYKEITLKHLEQFATEGEWANIAPCLRLPLTQNGNLLFITS